MTLGRLLLRNLLFHWRGNSAVVLGVAVGTAVLTGALLVGDSLRGSLREFDSAPARMGGPCPGRRPFHPRRPGPFPRGRARGPGFAVAGSSEHGRGRPRTAAPRRTRLHSGSGRAFLAHRPGTSRPGFLEIGPGRRARCRAQRGPRSGLARGTGSPSHPAPAESQPGAPGKPAGPARCRFRRRRAALHGACGPP